jgi:hypothetical protein
LEILEVDGQRLLCRGHDRMNILTLAAQLMGVALGAAL